MIMKSNFNFIRPVLVLLAIVFTTGCDEVNCFSVTGDVVDRPYSIAAISGLRMYCEGTVYLSQGDSQSVVLHSDEQLFKVLQFHITDGVLIMEFSEDCVEHIGTFELFITTTQDLKSIDLIGSGNVIGLDSLQATQLSISVSGSGNVELAMVYSEQMDLNISGSGDVSVSGPDTLIRQSNTISGSGNIHSFQLKARDVSVNGTGSGNLEVFALDTLHGSISGSGNARYKGDPGVSVSSSGSGQVINAN
jgi:hypothetical protein